MYGWKTDYTGSGAISPLLIEEATGKITVKQNRFSFNISGFGPIVFGSGSADKTYNYIFNNIYHEMDFSDNNFVDENTDIDDQITPAGAVNVSGDTTGVGTFGDVYYRSCISSSVTPTLDFDTTGDLSVTYNTGNTYLEYTKRGRRIDFTCEVQATAFTETTASGTLLISGLPFLAMASRDFALSVSSLQGITYPSGFTSVSAEIVGGTSDIVLRAQKSADSTATRIATTDVTGLPRVSVSGSYFTDT
jgi:hypothetical protein